MAQLSVAGMSSAGMHISKLDELRDRGPVKDVEQSFVVNKPETTTEAVPRNPIAAQVHSLVRSKRNVGIDCAITMKRFY